MLIYYIIIINVLYNNKCIYVIFKLENLVIIKYVALNYTIKSIYWLFCDKYYILKTKGSSQAGVGNNIFVNPDCIKVEYM